MSERMDAQGKAALAAADARAAIAKRIVALVPTIEDQDSVQIVLHLAEAYAHLAAEPPRARVS
jgi:hypothetical protein